MEVLNGDEFVDEDGKEKRGVNQLRDLGVSTGGNGKGERETEKTGDG